MTLLSSTRARSQQQRALRTLDDILSETGGVRLPPLRWTVEPNSSITGHVPPMGSEGEIREVFRSWTALLGARPLAEHGTDDRLVLRAVAPRWGIFHVYVSVQATVPRVLSEQLVQDVSARAG
ncbi:MAG TPA: hypothetical protein VE781_06975 [Kineosporiaceae bacterium]|nr:hypothetical protein [Kineosporiaceae bacterium]